MRTASATEAVFSPPYVPPRPERTRYAPRQPAPPVTAEPFPPPVVRQQPTALPPTTRLELPRPAPPTRALDLPPPRTTEPERTAEPGRPAEPERPESGRSEPGSWREIIARFERDLGDVPEDEIEQEHLDEEDRREDLQEKEEEEKEEEEEEEEDVTAVEAAAPGVGGLPSSVPEPLEGVEPPSLDEPMSWELAAMTTPDYVPPHSIHDPEHDSWPVEARDGDAVPAWSDEVPEDARTGASAADEIGELLLDEVVPADPWDAVSEPDEPADLQTEFPLDAFIVPVGVKNVTGYEDDVAHRVAQRLDVLAQQLRDRGFGALASNASVDELSRVLAAIVSGYVVRES